jgi:hypothetical protein
MRKPQLSLPASQRPRARSLLSIDAQRGWKDGDGNVFHRGGIAESATRGADLPSLSAAEPRATGSERTDLSPTTGACRSLAGRGKKTAAAIQEQISQELTSPLQVILTGWCQPGRWDLEAMEMRIRTAAHLMGAKPGWLSRAGRQWQSRPAMQQSRWALPLRPFAW